MQPMHSKPTRLRTDREEERNESIYKRLNE
jgi:hypothetical protein